MKTFITTIITIMTLASSIANADFYDINIKKIDTKTALINNSIPIEWTYSCFELYSTVISESAILKYEQYGFDNYVLFNNGTKCDVKYGQ